MSCLIQLLVCKITEVLFSYVMINIAAEMRVLYCNTVLALTNIFWHSVTYNIFVNSNHDSLLLKRKNK